MFKSVERSTLYFSIRKTVKAKMRRKNLSKCEIREILEDHHARRGHKLGHIFTLWEIPGENEKEFLVEHITAYVSDEKADVLGVFHKIRDRVLEVAPETSLTGVMDDQAFDCILTIKSYTY